MNNDTPVYSETEEIQDTGRPSADEIRESVSAEGSRQQAGVFGRAPEVQREEPVEQDPIDPDHIAATISENLELRGKLGVAEYDLQEVEEQRLDTLAYLGERETREEYVEAADELLEAGGGERLEALVTEWSDRDAEGAQAWLEAREFVAAQVEAAAATQAVQTMEVAHEAALADALAAFQAKHGIETNDVMFKLVTEAMAATPNAANALSSPQALTSALEAAREQAADAYGAYEGSANEANFRGSFRQEMARHGVFGNQEAKAAMTSRPVGPQSMEELTAEIVARAKGTKAQRAARSEANQAAFREQFKELTTSEWADENRAGAARALKARAEGKDRKPGAF